MTRFIDKQSRIIEISVKDRLSGASYEEELFHTSDLSFNPYFNAYEVEDIDVLIDKMNDIRFAVGLCYGKEPGEKTMNFDYERIW